MCDIVCVHAVAEGKSIGVTIGTDNAKLEHELLTIRDIKGRRQLADIIARRIAARNNAQRRPERGVLQNCMFDARPECY
jgi:hypothetical protein